MSSKNARPTLNQKQVKALTRDQWELKFSELFIVNLTNFFVSTSPNNPIYSNIPTLSFSKFSSTLIDAIYAMQINYGPRPEDPK